MNWETELKGCTIFIKPYNQGESDIYTDTHGIIYKDELNSFDGREEIARLLVTTPTPPRLGEVYDRIAYIHINNNWHICGFVTTFKNGKFSDKDRKQLNDIWVHGLGNDEKLVYMTAELLLNQIASLPE